MRVAARRRSVAGTFALMWFGMLVMGSLSSSLFPLAGLASPGSGATPAWWADLVMTGSWVSMGASLALLLGTALAYGRPRRTWWWASLIAVAIVHVVGLMLMWGPGRPTVPTTVGAVAIGAVSLGLLVRMQSSSQNVRV